MRVVTRKLKNLKTKAIMVNFNQNPQSLKALNHLSYVEATVKARGKMMGIFGSIFKDVDLMEALRRFREEQRRFDRSELASEQMIPRNMAAFPEPTEKGCPTTGPLPIDPTLPPS